MYLNIENELVGQKDHIIGLVNDGKFEEALTLLNFVEPLWNAARYTYKVAEIRQRIRDIARHNEIQAEHHKTAAKWKRLRASV